MNIIECTIRMKEQARDHYRQLADRVAGAELQRIFSLLAAAEEEHIQRLRVIGQEVESSSTAAVDEGACRFNPAIGLVDPELELENDPDAYRHVLKEEEDTIGFLEQVRSQTDNEQTRWLCGMLAEKEREHLTMLANIYSFVEEPRTYLEWGEFGNLKGL
ncbi:ferritin-like domain-containing protein [Pelotalea chapellei]|uniref:Ferritin family protein n=1 Tax=Pelotalea chapellei TaxID=44671 RepID=A0ABS5UA60_9BACT|nr:ferritin family protein [Pelotalea chapellei]MBT1072539.1 ferritin family protein [Pelotalea chapellei]